MPRLTLDALEVLDAIDRKGSFAAAAAALHRVPSAITYTVRRLEEDLGVSLFDRRGHRARFTAAGRAVLEDGRRLLGAADTLAGTARRVATGWETELRVAVDAMFPLHTLCPLLERFQAAAPDVNLRLSSEVLAGSWEALIDGRADLAIGAPGDAPPGGGYATRLIGQTQFVFAAAADHPIHRLPAPVSEDDIRRFTAVVVGDTARRIPRRSMGVIEGQRTVTVPDLETKIAFQARGVGVGFVPRHLAARQLEAGTLVEVPLGEPRPPGPVHLAWRTPIAGRALGWLVDALDPPDLLSAVLRGPSPLS